MLTCKELTQLQTYKKTSLEKQDKNRQNFNIV